MATAESAISAPERRELYLDRRVCTVTPDRIDVHPARSIIFLPLLTLILGIGVFPAVYFFGDSLPLWALVVVTFTAIIIVPVSGMGLVYSIAGAHIVVDRQKQSAVLQQGYLGMGVGTEELVPFWKLDYMKVEEVLPNDPRFEEFAQFEVAIVKISTRELTVGTVTTLRSERAEGLARAREVATLIADLAGSTVKVIESPRVAVDD